MDKRNHPFRIIEGGGEKPRPAWLSLPKLIIAKSHTSRDAGALYRVSQDTITTNLLANRMQPLLDFWSCVYGRTPPVANIGAFQNENEGKTLHSLAEAHACFRGLKRPVGQDDRGWDYVAFISKPKWFFRSERLMVTAARIAAVSDDLVFVTYVRLDRRREEGVITQTMGMPVRGVVTHWEFVEADPEDKQLPIDFDRRYTTRSW